jgi:hypothetical protein
LIAEEVVREALINDRHRPRRIDFAGRENPAADQRQTHRLEVIFAR